ncbi:MAG TPA: hypothetical protein VFM93_12425 [Candidatus Limnocylindria bacterium]|nr:hypothetical protein [Candidatus Limnocylindria bacterium]
MRSIALAVLAMVVASACASAPAAAQDERVLAAESVVDRFRALFEERPASIAEEVMGLDAGARATWGPWLARQRAWLGHVESVGPRSVLTYPTKGWTTVELRYETKFYGGSARELFVVRVEHEGGSLAFWAWWWP